MSAYLVSRGHIRYLVEAALRLQGRRMGPFSYYHGGKRHDVNELNADAIGTMLWTENARSIAHRYPSTDSDTRPGPIDDGPEMGYVHRAAWQATLDPVQVMKAIRCYTYQSCEHPGWETSESKALVDDLFLLAASCLPGYDDAEWGCPDSFEDDPPRVPANVLPFRA